MTAAPEWPSTAQAASSPVKHYFFVPPGRVVGALVPPLQRRASGCLAACSGNRRFRAPQTRGIVFEIHWKCLRVRLTNRLDASAFTCQVARRSINLQTRSQQFALLRLALVAPETFPRQCCSAGNCQLCIRVSICRGEQGAVFGLFLDYSWPVKAMAAKQNECIQTHFHPSCWKCG